MFYLFFSFLIKFMVFVLNFLVSIFTVQLKDLFFTIQVKSVCVCVWVREKRTKYNVNVIKNDCERKREKKNWTMVSFNMKENVRKTQCLEEDRYCIIYFLLSWEKEEIDSVRKYHTHITLKEFFSFLKIGWFWIALQFHNLLIHLSFFFYPNCKIGLVTPHKNTLYMFVFSCSFALKNIIYIFINSRQLFEKRISTKSLEKGQNPFIHIWHGILKDLECYLI